MKNTTHSGGDTKPIDRHMAPGSPGAEPTWSPAAKSGVGCAISSSSRIWFTLGRGIVTEVYHPWIDHAAIRDLQLIVTGPDGFFSEEKVDCSYHTSVIEAGIPAYQLTNDCLHNRYQIRKEIIADPDRDVILQRVQFKPRKGSLADYRGFVLLSPRLGDQGESNSGWVGSFHGRPMLFAERESHALALGCSVPWLRRSVGYVGTSDAWQDLKLHGEMTWEYNCASDGQVALAGEIDLRTGKGEFILALGVDRSPEAAALNASLSLAGCFNEARDRYVRQWQEWQKRLKSLSDGTWTTVVSANQEQRHRPDSSRPRVGSAKESNAAIDVDLYRMSMMVLRVHRSKQFAGASVASLAIPWGEARGDKDRGGYHLVWPRDLVEESGGFLAGGALDEARCVLNYLRVTQKADGGWTQMMWVDGTPYSDGVQLDESSLPILLVALARREKALSDEEVKSLWPMVRSAAGYVIRHGPSTGQSRWENSSGLSPYTLATEVAALIAAAAMADQFGERGLASYFRETADLWNDSIEEWTYAVDTPLAKKLGVDGYYVRLAPSPGLKTVRERGEHPTLGTSRDLPNAEVISPDALALVRFGLRKADDPRILNTLKAIDAINKADTPAGPCWRRYTGGYYGETNAGEPFTGGKDLENHGRAWPLLTGERGHYELAAGNKKAAEKMLTTMDGLCSEAGLLPEQVWDQPDLPDHHLFLGRPAGSAMPLAWTHSEYVRLLRSLHDGHVFDLPVDSHERYAKHRTKSHLALWRFDHRTDSFPEGRQVRVELHAHGVIHYSLDNWQTTHDHQTHESGVGLHVADIPTCKMSVGERVHFTFRWPDDGNRWEGRDFVLTAKSV